MVPLTADHITDLFRVIAARLMEARTELGVLDGVIGDADHGNSMAEGFAAIVRASSDAAMRGAPAGDLFPVAAQSFLSAVGATTGPLYASAFLRAGKLYTGRIEIAPEAIPSLIPAFADGIRERGKAQPGDKTMLDVWAPAARAVQQAEARGLDPIACLDEAVNAAEDGREATRAMVASVGRAARLGERTLGHVDPGAASATIIIAALRDAMRRRERAVR
ncbi:dihydroxyacetone kinase subunit L [Kaistia algarum]|uniref:dihydroxyacetone kinase subunit DhaL n=1 Tax=Kaistia algarum TaxID=2083279 RepID=UPI000CE83494|nr:dihydroxyacetone kinase subunit DhaL [Kaistia algarum]MCX5514735.1 dihydroxyacetone kinase subunit DhaL [Kaistia algarum]PPE78844.1 dihydroxyacetone kinase subunit L [Kaistia algarum]